MARILLVRHGQSRWNAEGRWQGQADPDLSELGERQAIAAARGIGDVDAVYASDLIRARHTAELVAAQLGVDVAVDPRLRERRAGDWEGRTRAEIDEGWPGYLDSGRRPAGYESDESVLGRALAALAGIAAAHDGDVLVITHGGVVRTIERHLGSEADGLIPNLGGRRLHHHDGRLSLGGRVVLLDESQVTRPEQL